MHMAIVSLGSVTYATKAARLLRRIGIAATVVKLDAGQSARGCTHGIEMPARELFRAGEELQKNNILFERYPFA